MKVLFVSASPINNSLSIGNTFLNVFPEETELASVYTKNGIPDSRILKAFRINEKMILKGKHGAYVNERYLKGNSDSKGEINPELVKLAQKKRYTAMYWLQNLIWRIPVWKSAQLKRFILDFEPDIIFTIFANNIYLNRLILCIADVAQKPLVVYGWDNNYFDNPFEKSLFKKLIHKSEKRYMRKVAARTEKMLVISDIMKEEYEKEFSKQCDVIAKCYDFDETPHLKENVSTPLKLVYTGNLGINRWKSLAIIVNALKKVNSESLKAQLQIYSPTPLTDEMKNALISEGNSCFMGSVSADKIPDIQRDADVLVHIESFDEKSLFAVKYSFSTKIVDYLKCARPILAVGPKDVASIDYFIRNDSAIAVTDEAQLADALEQLVNDSELRKEYAQKAYECGKNNHNELTVKTEFIKELERLKGDYV